MKNMRNILIFVMAFSASSAAISQNMTGYPLATNQIIEEVASHSKGIAVWWVGNDGWLIKSDDLLIGIDLELSPQSVDGKNNKIHQPPISASQVADELDIVFVTHEHGDHFHAATVTEIAKNQKCVFVVPENCVAKAKSCGIPDDRLVIVKPRNSYEVKGLQFSTTRAFHGGPMFTVFKDANMSDCGYLWTMQSKKVFHPGDTVLLEDHFEVGNLDLLFISPTVHNMHVRNASLLINQLEPANIIPQHFETYITTPDNMFWTKGYPDELKTALSKELQNRYHKLKQGEKFEIR